MSKGFDLNKIVSNWESEGTLEYKKRVLNRIPERCIKCHSNEINYWDETDEEIIFQCGICKRCYPIPFDPNKLKIYLFY